MGAALHILGFPWWGGLIIGLSIGAVGILALGAGMVWRRHRRQARKKTSAATQVRPPYPPCLCNARKLCPPHVIRQ